MTFLAKELLVVTLVHLIPRCEASCQREFALRSKELVMGTRYIENVARTLIGKFGVTWQDAQAPETLGSGHYPSVLYGRHLTKILVEVDKMRPETLGRIAVQGLARFDPRTVDREKIGDHRTSLYKVHCGEYLHRNDSGREILVTLVVTVLVAEMFDQLRRKYHLEAGRHEDI